MPLIPQLLLRTVPILVVPLGVAGGVAVLAAKGAYEVSRSGTAVIVGVDRDKVGWIGGAGAVAGAAVPVGGYLIYREMFQKPQDWRDIRASLQKVEADAVKNKAAKGGISGMWTNLSQTTRALRAPVQYWAINLFGSAAIAGVGASIGQRWAQGSKEESKRPKAKPAAAAATAAAPVAAKTPVATVIVTESKEVKQPPTVTVTITPPKPSKSATELAAEQDALVEAVRARATVAAPSSSAAKKDE